MVRCEVPLQRIANGSLEDLQQFVQDHPEMLNEFVSTWVVVESELSSVVCM